MAAPNPLPDDLVAELDTILGGLGVDAIGDDARAILQRLVGA